MISESLASLIRRLSKCPGMGLRSSERLVLSLLKHKETLFRPLLKELTVLIEEYIPCTQCGYFDRKNPCILCTSPQRQNDILCVVSSMGDVWTIERAGFFNGRYHILGGVLSSFENRHPHDLYIEGLIQRLRSTTIQEVVLALDSNIEGQTTLHFVRDYLLEHMPELKISALARGIPMGGELSYLDHGTLTSAFIGRKVVEKPSLSYTNILKDT